MDKKQESQSLDRQEPPTAESKIATNTGFRERHICLFYVHQDDQWQMIRPYLVEHLSAGMPVLYVQDSTPSERLLELLRAERLPVDDLIARGLLRIIPTEEVYVLTSRFDYQRVLTFIESAILDAQAWGYDRLLITGETRWWLPNVPGAEWIAHYEALLNPLVEKYPGVTIVCQFDLRRFDSPTMLNLLLTHPAVHLPSGRVPGFYGL
jgi:hypothetical protein